MRKNLLFSLAISLCFFTSCVPMYQVFESNTTDPKFNKDLWQYENTEVKLSYNFWSNGGSIYFKLTNKLDSSIYIDWDRSHLIYNDISYEYWYDAEESKALYASELSSNSAYNYPGYNRASSSTISTKSTIVATSKVKNKKIIEIPPHSSIVISKFKINSYPYFNCDFNLKTIKKKNSNKKTFSADDSPVVFRNFITYSNDKEIENTKVVDNTFYISSVSFINEKEFKGKSLKSNDCDINGARIFGYTSELPFMNSKGFYIKIK